MGMCRIGHDLKKEKDQWALTKRNNIFVVFNKARID